MPKLSREYALEKAERKEREKKGGSSTELKSDHFHLH